ncbi:MAG: hypothetical protein LBB50_00025 [Oscillospiraceae bacterium]|nr:hypothetical protein [Oscillospiraceae bacterium]
MELPKETPHALRARVLSFACMAACLGLGTALVIWSPLAQQGAREGLVLCGQVIIPSMYPFFVLAGLFVRLHARRPQRHSPLLWAVLRQPPAALGAIVLGCLGGYPMGAKTAAQLLEQGCLTRQQAQRLQLFCVNAGPAYLIGAVGTAMIGSRRAGILLFVSMLAAGLLLGVLTRALAGEEHALRPQEPAGASRTPFDQLLLLAVRQATGAMLGVCAWIVLFATLCALLRLLPTGLWGTIPLLNVFFEVSSGTAAVTRAQLPLPVLCAALGWGGLGVHCQILGDLRKTGMPLRLFWVSRLLHGALAAAICVQLLRWFPVAASTMAGPGAGAATVRLWAVSGPAAAAVLFFCAFLILDLDLNRKMC